PSRELLVCIKRLLGLTQRVFGNSNVKARFVKAGVLLRHKRKLLSGFLEVTGLKMNSAKLEKRRDVLTLCLFGELLYGALQKTDSRFAVACEGSLDEVFKRADRSLSRVDDDLVARVGQR